MNTSSILRAGVIGAGRIGKIHAGNLVRQPGVRLKYVVDPDAKAAAALAAQQVACYRRSVAENFDEVISSI